jgi:hypothetical protein
VIPTWRPPSATLTPPAPKPVPDVRAMAPNQRGFDNTFAHFSYTFTNETTYLKITDIEYYARFALRELRSPDEPRGPDEPGRPPSGPIFAGLMYMSITILTANQAVGLPPVLIPSTLSSLVSALTNLGLGVAVAYINSSTVDIYLWSTRPLSAVRDAIWNAVNANMPTDVTLNAVYYIVGQNIMIWDVFYWDDGSVWADDPVRVYP